MAAARKLLALFQRQSRRAIFAQSLLVALLVGLFDFLSGYEVSVSVFYGIPILAVAWWCDRKTALLLAIICAIIWWWADFEAGHHYTRQWFVIWESTAHFGYFAIVALGGSSLRKQRDAAESRIRLLEYSQRLEREIIDISEREQQRIGRDLHDGVCQYFAAVGCAAASLKLDLANLGMPKEAAMAEELTNLLNEGVVQTRDLARGLVPVQMDEAGLGSALEELATSVSRLQNIACVFVTDGDATIGTPSVATHLYRIAQEAINNATRHGGAQNIRIELATSSRTTTLRITDDGTGISKTNQGSRGMGLNIMSYRARLVGGHLTIGERNSGGTSIACTLPQATLAAEEHVRAA
jgi:signal transduction histidine kinase